MKPTSAAFPRNVARAFTDDDLQRAMKRIAVGFPVQRERALAQIPEFDRLRDEAAAIRAHVIDHLPEYLEAFEAKARGLGVHVHWAETAAEARAIIGNICQQADSKIITRGKSMVSEEIELNPYLEQLGFTPVETDLGEYIVQLAKEPPSHLLGPAVHMTKERIAHLFADHHKTERRRDTAEALVGEAREVLRRRYFEADVAITGANFLVAESGAAVIVTNEGNGDLSHTLARTHIIVTGIEKVVPTYENLGTLLRVLARSATGQEMSVYTTLVSGPRRAEDSDGPENMHIVLVDNGRSKLRDTKARDALRCIRCAACLNYCPIYRNVGGHAYGWVYSGPIGAAIDPAYLGLAETRHLPSASTLCGRCQDVCPVRIPLPDILRHWRQESFEAALAPREERLGLKIWAFAARRPFLYRLGSRIASRFIRLLGQRLAGLPGASGWARRRDLPIPEGPTFFSQWKRHGGS